MLVDGPADWAETSIPTGSKLDLLQHAYNAQLGVAALPKDATITLVRFGGESCASSLEAASPRSEVLEVATDELALHPDTHGGEKDAKRDAFRYVAWSKRPLAQATSKRSAHVAVATVGRVEVWRVTVNDSLQAVLVGSYSKPRIRGVCWHPVADVLVVFNDVDVDLIHVTADGALRPRPLELMQDGKTKLCTWSPCGLVLARSTEICVDFLSWSSVDELGTVAPRLCSYRVDAPASATLLGGASKIGSISATVLLSASVCVVVTDTPLVLADFKPADPSLENGSSAAGSQAPSTTPTAASNVIDLTSLRITATSKSSLLNILDRPMIGPSLPAVPGKKRSSHLAVVAKNPAGEWQRYAQVGLDQLAIPDVVDVEALRVVVGSTISNRLIAIHLDHNLKSGWSASVSGDMDLPEGHVCRGVRLATTSPFVQVASTEKVKRTFFHASSGPQRIQLSKFKVPRRRRDPTEPPLPGGSEAATVAPAATRDEDRQSNTASPDVMATLLMRMDALQTLMVTRFDHVERRLDDIAQRLTSLEVKGQTATRPSL